MAIMITLSQVPPSHNALYANVKGKGRVKTKQYRLWRETALWEIKAQRPGSVSGPYAIYIDISRPNRRSDLVNREKAISDVLVAAGVIDDDRHCEACVMQWNDAIEGVSLIVEVAEGGRESQEARLNPALTTTAWRHSGNG